MLGTMEVEGSEINSQILIIERLTRMLVQCLVTSPDEVNVEVSREGDAVRLRVKVSESELGQVIGRKGRTAQALRTILVAASQKLAFKVLLDITSPEQVSTRLLTGE